MYKVGVCGHFGNKKTLLNGQTVKTKLLTEELNIALGSQSVKIVDTHNWKINPFMLFIRCCLLIKNCENIIILPAQNGISVFVPLFLLLNKVFNRKLHYVVIGGWLPEILRENYKLKNKVSKFSGVYVETVSMIKSLQEIGVGNVRKFPNFKRLDVLGENELYFSSDKPLKLCTFSRVMKEKGIEDAIEAVKAINKAQGKVMFTLDIYGQVDEKYSIRFKQLKKEFPSYISYKGSVNYNDSVEVLKDYFALLFPTHFKTEGIPGTIIDAYAAGVPVIASKWDSANEVIDQGRTGYIYDFMQKSKLEELLNSILNDPKKTEHMKKNCLKRAGEFLPKRVIGEFIKNL